MSGAVEVEAELRDEIERYIVRCREMSEGDKYSWWTRLAEILVTLRADNERLRRERDEAQAERKLSQAALTARARSMSKLRRKLVHITDHIEDEGDRRYFGSTNHADELMEIFHDLDAWNWEAITNDGKLPDPYKTARKAIARAQAAEAAQATLLAQVEKMRGDVESAYEEAARIAEAKYTDETVRKNRKGNPYPWGAAAIYAGQQIAKAIRAALTKEPS